MEFNERLRGKVTKKTHKIYERKVRNVGEICNLMLQFTQIKVTFFCLGIDFFFLKFVQHGTKATVTIKKKEKTSMR